MRKGKIPEEVVKLILSWRHSGFKVRCDPRIQPGDEKMMENLARYVVRESFSRERVTYLLDEPKVIYQSKTKIALIPWSAWQPCSPMSRAMKNERLC